LAPPESGSYRADDAVALLSRQRGRGSRQERRPPHRDRPPRPAAGRHCFRDRARGSGETLNLRIAIDYSARDAILTAAAKLAGISAPTRELFSELVTGEAGLRDVDLIIRTSGEKRLSDFLLWEGAYAELYFTERMWPDFDGEALAEALASFHRRERRFGGLPSLPLEPAASF
jgi:undecaprenyl diphosphate synthase